MSFVALLTAIGAVDYSKVIQNIDYAKRNS